MKLEVGMYARQDDGTIFKITKLDMELCDNKTKINCKKANHNITDLIEENDIILGKDGNIYQVYKIDGHYIFTYNLNDEGEFITLVDYQIDKILTHEQFENNCYKIGN